MNNQSWIEHLKNWKLFLNMLIDSTDDDGQRIKYMRQIRTIEKVSCGAVLNPSLLLDFINPIQEVIEDNSCDKYFFKLNAAQKNKLRYLVNTNFLQV